MSGRSVSLAAPPSDTDARGYVDVSWPVRRVDYYGRQQVMPQPVTDWHAYQSARFLPREYSPRGFCICGSLQLNRRCEKSMDEGFSLQHGLRRIFFYRKPMCELGISVRRDAFNHLNNDGVIGVPKHL